MINASGRPPISKEDKNDNRIFALLRDHQNVRVGDVPDGHEFRLIERKIPTQRITGADDPDSGRGGMDYIAVRNATPILGEIKVKDDANSFYAFIQLLTYLSEMATPNQIQRAIGHKLFGSVIEEISSFDLSYSPC